jgi:hypothetical protein
MFPDRKKFAIVHSFLLHKSKRVTMHEEIKGKKLQDQVEARTTVDVTSALAVDS